ncbi:MAG: acetylxylan esterase [Acidobacteriaceae bacterium]
MPSLSHLTGCVLFLAASAASLAQTSAPPPVTFTAEQDHQNMMDQLGIEALRPGPSGDEKAPSHANYDESKANPYPNLPDPLTMNDGRKVTTSEMWWKQRRPQIVEMYSRYVYGFVPRNVPKVTWTVRAVDHERIGFTPVIAKDLIGTVDNAAYPDITVKIHMTLVTPEKAQGPVPVLMMFAPADFPAPHEPTEEEFARINKAWKARLIQQDPSLQAVFEAHPAWEPVKATPFQFPQLNADGGLPNTWQLVGAGWGFALLDPASVQADNGAGLTRGIIGLVNKGQPRTPEQWGALRAWAWGAGRGLDYLETDPAVDAKQVGIEGVSRYGKAALVTMAFDPRFAMVLVGSSGKGGATLLRRNYGEAVENLADGEYYWMAGNFMKYGASKIKVGAKLGSMNPGDIPVDSNELIALCAPRLTFISYGVPAKGDARWLDHEGSWMATVDANRVFTFLGAKGLGVSGFTVGTDYHTAPMPPVNTGLLDGKLAWRQHDGGHTDAPNMTYFLQWVAGWRSELTGISRPR